MSDTPTTVQEAVAVQQAIQTLTPAIDEANCKGLDPKPLETAKQALDEKMDKLTHEIGCGLPQHLRDRVFVIAQGASLPGQGDGHPVCAVLAPPNPMGAASVWLQTLPSLPEPSPEAWLGVLRYHMFRVDVEVTLGTVDEIVADFREKLLRAVVAMCTNAPAKYEDVTGSIEKAQQLGYTPGRAFTHKPLDTAAPVVRDFYIQAGRLLANAPELRAAPTNEQAEPGKGDA